MTPRQFLRELVYPLTHGGLLAALVFFAALLQLAIAARLLGLWLLIIVGAAGAKFLVQVLRARALGVDPPVPGAGLFNLVAEPWALSPWLFLTALAALAWSLWSESEPAAVVLAVAGLSVFPAAALRVAVTRVPMEILRPAGVLGVIRRTGIAYAMIFVGAAVGAAFVLLGARFVGMNASGRLLATSWVLVTLFSLSGAVFYNRRAELDLPVLRSPEKLRERSMRFAEREREEVLGHAYGLISRGNGAAGIAHIRGWLERTEADELAWSWFFEKLGDWESPRAQIEFGRDYVGRLATAGAWPEALRVAAHCLALDPGFRPNADDRQGLVAAARRAGESGLAEALAGDSAE